MANQIFVKPNKNDMQEEIFHIESISKLHQLIGYEKPKHPLISIIDVSKMVMPKEWVGLKLRADFYVIALKNADCGLQYGRHYYDFQEGVLVFTAPGQVVSATEETTHGDDAGWMMFFHPDLLRKYALGSTIEDYTFFSYEAHEALHLSDSEQETLNDCVAKINSEIEARIDNHSQKVIVAGLELLLSYCSRFYDRQFITRSGQNSDVLSIFKKELRRYFKSDLPASEGLPSIQFFADKAHLSTNYFSDLLKKETGKSAKDHINEYLVEQAKNLLISSNRSVSEIAYSLGFNYPHYFSRLFKSKTGMAPNAFRESLN